MSEIDDPDGDPEPLDETNEQKSTTQKSLTDMSQPSTDSMDASLFDPDKAEEIQRAKEISKSSNKDFDPMPLFTENEIKKQKREHKKADRRDPEVDEQFENQIRNNKVFEDTELRFDDPNALQLEEIYDDSTENLQELYEYIANLEGWTIHAPIGSTMVVEKLNTDGMPYDKVIADLYKEEDYKLNGKLILKYFYTKREKQYRTEEIDLGSEENVVEAMREFTKNVSTLENVVHNSYENVDIEMNGTLIKWRNLKNIGKKTEYKLFLNGIAHPYLAFDQDGNYHDIVDDILSEKQKESLVYTGKIDVKEGTRLKLTNDTELLKYSHGHRERDISVRGTKRESLEEDRTYEVEYEYNFEDGDGTYYRLRKVNKRSGELMADDPRNYFNINKEDLEWLVRNRTVFEMEN